jgi:hypothetical protein
VVLRAADQRAVAAPDSSYWLARRNDMIHQAMVSPVLTIDETTAHVTSPAELADELLTWFQVRNIHGRRRQGEGVAGLDVIDFGNPSPAEEQRIRAAFEVWRRRNCSPHSRGLAWGQGAF